ncbi:MAG: hypothetical protein ABJQ23_04930 [Shimia thalassica]|uniref:hypothetical protein n=1 Tax=Shimia thalassica TaxID=1715693 RepID=UPI003299E8E8
MGNRGTYVGGSTVIHGGSGWFSKPDPNVNPETGETRAERIRRIAEEMRIAKAAKTKKAAKAKKPAKKKTLKKKPPLFESPNEMKRLQQVEQNRAKAREKNASREKKLSVSEENQAQKMASVIVERKRKKLICKPT